jgi:hypothetical protein
MMTGGALIAGNNPTEPCPAPNRSDLASFSQGETPPRRVVGAFPGEVSR